MRTVKGIELDLNESNYTVEAYNYIFYFSSQIYANKFKNLLSEYIDIETIKLYNKYKVRSNFKQFLAFSLYRKIETRGFRIYDKRSSKELTPFSEFHEYII